MNRKGFTLVELIATIVLLGIVASISFVSINGVLEQNKENNCKTVVGNIKSAASEYVSDNRYAKDANGNDVLTSKDFTITAKTLIDKKYLSSPMYNPYDKSKLEDADLNGITIRIVLNDNYTVKDVTVSKEILKCQ